MNNELIKRILSSLVLLPLVVFIIIKGSFFFNFFLILCFFISLIEWLKMTKNKKYNFLGIFFVILSFYSIYEIRNIFDNNYFVFLLITLICVATDIGGFLFGKLIKGPKLTRISPNKTYSGMIGSFILPLIIIYLFSENSNFVFKHEFNLQIFIFTIFVSTVSQLGDIIISYFKRESKIKDTGNIIPGHGGLLDRIDGMIFAFPASYFFFLINGFDIF